MKNLFVGTAVCVFLFASPSLAQTLGHIPEEGEYSKQVSKSKNGNILADTYFIAPLSKNEPLAPKWEGHIELEGKLGTDRDLGEVAVFIPVLQNEDSMLFTDLRFRMDDNDSKEFNIGLGYRKIVGSDLVVGGYAFYDRRRTPNDNSFNQATIGVEALKTDYEARINAYIPESTEEDIGGVGVTRAVATGGNIQLQTFGNGTERALPGFDAELGFKLDLTSNLDLWTYGGGYYFDADDFEKVSGPRVRMELQYNGVPFLGEGSQFTVGLEGQTDDVRGDQAFALGRLRVPFSTFKMRTDNGHRPKLSPIEERMTSRIYRDVDIVAVEAEASDEPILTETASVTLENGAQVSTFTAIDAGDDPAVEIAGAGVNALVVLDGSLGSLTPSGQILVQDGQTIIGGGTSLMATGTNSGARVPVTFAGVRPTIDGGGANRDIVIDGVNDILIQNINLTNTGSRSLLIINGSGNVNLRNINASNNTAVGLVASGVGTVVAASNVNLTNNNIGAGVLSAANLNLSNSIISNSLTGIDTNDFGPGNPTLNLSNTTIENIGNNVLQLSDVNVSGSGNIVNGPVGGVVCSNSGGNTGSISFDNILGGGAGTCP